MFSYKELFYFNFIQGRKLKYIFGSYSISRFIPFAAQELKCEVRDNIKVDVTNILF